MTSKQVIAVIVVTFLVGMVWLIADIIFNTKASVPISEKLQVLLEPVTPTFNARVLEKIDRETIDREAITVTDAEEPVSLEVPIPSAALIPELPLSPATESSTEGGLNQ